MDCYRTACQEACDRMKVRYCLRRLSKEQFELKERIKGRSCMCGAIMPLVKHRGERKRICFACKEGLAHEVSQT